MFASAAPVALPDDGWAPRPEVPLATQFDAAVTPRLLPPAEDVVQYAVRLDAALDGAGVRIDAPRFVVVVDRSPQVQALLLFWGTHADWRMVGAAPVSTGLPGRFDHFATPLGVFEHSLANPGSSNASAARSRKDASASRRR